jgi:hypothetical protein
MDNEYGHALNAIRNGNGNRDHGLDENSEAGAPYSPRQPQAGAGATPPPNAMQQDRQEYVEREAGARTEGSRPGVVGPVRNLIFGAVRTSIEAFRRASQGFQQENAGAAGAREEVERAGVKGDYISNWLENASITEREKDALKASSDWLENESITEREKDALKASSDWLENESITGGKKDKSKEASAQVLSSGSEASRASSSSSSSSSSSTGSNDGGLSEYTLYGFDPSEFTPAPAPAPVTTQGGTNPTTVPAVVGLAEYALGANFSGSSRGNSPGQ